jgi:muconolactone D-isomerase
MARYLVRISIVLPPDMSDDERAELVARERARGRALKDAGTIQDMWRLPGQLANVGIWRAENATGLHEALTSLPLWRWAGVEVTALADHYLTSCPEGRA